MATGSDREIVDNRIGSGSDYSVFLNHLGIPIADITFDGPYGVYHSLYDTRAWVAPIWRSRVSVSRGIVQLWGVLTLRLANADAIPLDYEESASRIAGSVSELEQRCRWRPASRRWAGPPLAWGPPPQHSDEAATRPGARRRGAAGIVECEDPDR